MKWGEILDAIIGKNTNWSVIIGIGHFKGWKMCNISRCNSLASWFLKLTTVRWPNSTLFFLKLLYPKHGTSWTVKLKFAFISMWQAIYNSILEINNSQISWFHDPADTPDSPAFCSASGVISDLIWIFMADISGVCPT